MHDIQKRLLSLAAHNDLSKFTYRDLAAKTGAKHASQVRHHLSQLEKQGKIIRDASGAIKANPTGDSSANTALLSIPIFGCVDCGIATKFAMDTVEGYLTVSPNSTECKDLRDVFALKACGDSMNMASIQKKTVDNSDYVLVKKYRGENINDGEYLVSLINGMANLKKFRRDSVHNRIALLSVSTQNYPPIIIAESDSEYYEVVGKAVDVIKGVAHLT